MKDHSLQEPAIHEFIRSRQSIRRFDDRPVPGDVLVEILKTATSAPSAHNRQPWRFVILRTEDSRERMTVAMSQDYRRALQAEGLHIDEINALVARSHDRICQAPAAILLCMDPSGMDTYADEERNQGERTMAVQSVAIAGGYLLLAAHASGLGAVWMCAPLFVPERVRRALDLPDTWTAQAIFLLGYPAARPARRPRRSLEEVCLEL